MARIAGNAPGYTFKLHRQSGDETSHGFTLPSVTTILSEVLGKPAGAMAHWGYNLAIEGIRTLAEVAPEIASFPEDEIKAALKGAEFAPNLVRDKAGDRGNNAHRLLELLATAGPASIEGDRIDFVDENGEWERVELDGYCRGVLAWWNNRMTDWSVEAAETPVWSLGYGFCGTIDLARRSDETGVVELVDLKTHKPKTQAQPAYLHDLFQLAAYRLAWEQLFDELVPGNTVVVVDDKGRFFEDHRAVDPLAFLAVLDIYRAITALNEED